MGDYFLSSLILKILNNFMIYKSKTTILENQKYIIEKLFSGTVLLEGKNYINEIKLEFISFLESAK